MDPSKRFATIVLALGTIVLLVAIGIGQRMGYRILGQSTELTPSVLPTVLITPEPEYQSAASYGPDWRRSQTLSAAADPGFPDPRVPPVPLPTRRPPPTAPPASPTPTPNLNLPIWRRATPLPTPMPIASPTASAAATPQPG
ncbi:MAG: hypothetical protein ACREMP_11120 [Candidatus Tyrphobacter sp.]